MEYKVIDSSLKSILSVTMPMILSVMSTNLMYMIDRFMLAGYSMDAMNAVIISGNFVCIFTFMFVGIANTVEIFVGQYNGAKKYTELSSPVWQMLYMSIMSCAILWPIAYFSDSLNTLPTYYLEDGLIFQKILMYFGFLPPIKAALAAFFIGQGKTKIVTFAVMIGTLILVVLNYFLIYGYKNIIPSLGCMGTAIATVISELVEIAIYTAIFLNKNNRKFYHTFNVKGFNKELFLKCLAIGAPVAFGNFISMLAWYIVQTVISYVSKDAATVYNIGINIYIFFIFVGEGMNKGIASICSNMIGQGDLSAIEKIRKICVKMALFIGIITAIPLIGFPEWIINTLDVLSDSISRLYWQIKIMLFLIAIAVTLETLVLSIWGILIAGGDTKYTTIVAQLCLWVFVVIPTTILYFMNSLTSIPLIYIFMIMWLIATQFFIHKRYKSLKWYNKLG